MKFIEPSVREFYNERFRTSGKSFRTVGWGSTESQELRFEQLFAGVSVGGTRVLDVGCGLGDLASWLIKRHGANFRYLGIDIADELVADARRRLGSDRITFLAADVRTVALPTCDIAVASGAFSYRPAWTVEEGLHMLDRMKQSATTCAASNFLIDRVDFVEPRNLHYSPEVVLKHVLGLTDVVRLTTGYGLFEFTVQLFASTRETAK